VASRQYWFDEVAGAASAGHFAGRRQILRIDQRIAHLLKAIFSANSRFDLAADDVTRGQRESLVNALDRRLGNPVSEMEDAKADVRSQLPED
jgi:hypothetical protein